MRRRGRAWLILTTAPALLPAGCADDLQRARGAESVLDVVRTNSAGPPPAELAVMAIDPYDANRRYVGTIGLAGAFFANEAPYIALFEDNAKDLDAAVRAAAMRGLSNHGEGRHAMTLVAALRDPDKQVRLEAARGLQRLHDPAAIDSLLAAIREPVGFPPEPGEEIEPDVRAEAAAALGQYAHPRVVEGLIAAIRDESLAVNRAAAASLRILTGQDLGLDHEAWVTWRDSAGTADAMFRARTLYLYPAFRRSKRWWEYLPLIPPPPNEVPATPAGMPRNAP
jgi:hypothetical protein